MCVIAIATQRRMSLPAMRECNAYNPHGIGVSWVQDGKVHYRKGIQFSNEAHELLKDVPLPHVIHFRYATVGKVKPELCHPFVIRRDVPNFTIGRTTKTVLFHNGTIKDIEVFAKLAGASRLKTDSDSRIMAKICANRGQFLLEHVAERTKKNQYPNKFVTMNRVGDITIHGEFYRHNGINYSNLRWRNNVRTGTKFQGFNTKPVHSYYRQSDFIDEPEQMTEDEYVQPDPPEDFRIPDDAFLNEEDLGDKSGGS